MLNLVITTRADEMACHNHNLNVVLLICGIYTVCVTFRLIVLKIYSAINDEI